MFDILDGKKIDEMVSFYEVAFEEYLSTTDSPSERDVNKAHDIAKGQLITAYGNVGKVHNNHQLWGRIGQIKQARKNGIANMDQFVNQEDDNKAVHYFDSINWTDCWRTACKTGFVPYKDFVAGFLPEEKTSQWSSYRRFMEKEGWIFEPLEYGWKTTYVEPEPEPETKAQPMFFVTRELIDQIVTETVERLKKSL